MSRKWPESTHPKLQAKRMSSAGVPRPFLPPSYYAAAGGIPYPGKKHDAIRRDNFPSDAAAERFANGREAQRPRPSPDPSESISSFELRSKGPQYKLSGDVKSALSTHSASSGAPVLKRQGLPNVEAQLLPSLQSTIHRMTRPPSRILADSTNATATPEARERSKLNYTSPPLQHHRQETNAASPSADTTPKSRIPQKSALKSALRTGGGFQKPPTTPLADGPQTPVVTLSPRGNSLRSVKSLLSRKLGNSTPTISSLQPKSNIPPPSSLLRDDRSTSAIHVPTSHLPRPKFKMENKSPAPPPTQPAQTHDATHTDESDVENKYQRQWMERRRLTVTNAEVVPSGSSSDGSLDSSYNNSMLQTPKLGTYSRPEWPLHKQQHMGLGFNMQPTPPTKFPHSPLLPNIEFPGERDRTKILRFSLPPSGSDASLYSNHHLSYPGSWNDSDYATEREDDEPAAPRTQGSVGRANAEVHRGYWGGELSGSGSEDFESEEQLNVRAGFHAYDEEMAWGNDDSLRTPVANSYQPSRQSLLPTRLSTVPQRAPVSRDAESNYTRSPSVRDNTVDPGGHPWAPQAASSNASRQPSAQMSNEWFDESSGDYENDLEHIPLTPHRRAPFPAGYEALSLSQQLKRRAAQEREAFGIPPSLSDEERLGPPAASQRWSQSDSYRSSVGSARWEWNEEGHAADARQGAPGESLSLGAEAMLKSLHPEWARNASVLSAASSAASFYEDQSDTFETATEEPYDPSRFGREESSATRQERQRHESREDVILEFLHSEETFLSNTQTCINIFILPIRNQNSRSWIGGVPANVSRLLDWYEDIVNLHLAIYQSLESSAAMQESDIVISGLANYMSEFVTKLHVYQPYLVNLADVLEDIAFLASDTSSDFGEFIKIQEKALMNGWSLERLLMEPVNRLAMYQVLFTNLLESTPEDHPEFLMTMMLSRSADTVMRVMTEVKVRETEHRLIQSLAEQISDEAVSRILGTRERRLLHSGTLRLLSPLASMTIPGHHQAKAQKRSSKLAQAIAYWDRRPDRSGSIKSTASSVTTTASFHTTGSYGPPPSLDPRSARMPLLRGLFKGKLAVSAASSSSRAFGEADLSPSVPPGHVQVFVFSDLILVVLPKTAGEAKYSLAPKIGLAKVFSVLKGSEEADDIHVRLVPVNPDSVEKDVLPRFATITEAVFQLPESVSRDSVENETWIQAFDGCSKDTLQLLSCPGPRKTVPSERSKDTWVAVSSLVSSGLPMPKSPSGNLPDLFLILQQQQQGYGNSTSDGEKEQKMVEREERGWWSLRYQQVLGELMFDSTSGDYRREERKEL